MLPVVGDGTPATGSLEEKMLVLSRTPGQSIVIPGDAIAAFKDWQDDGIEIVLVAIEGNKVRLGIDAPDEVDIYRREVLTAIRRDERRKKGEKA
jgi:carbon storage regulator